jgi:vesicle coat complex subunit
MSAASVQRLRVGHVDAGCQDADPYVRKTAVLAVAKFYDLSPTICEQNGFLEELEGMLSDSNPMVRPRCPSHLVTSI